MRIAPPALPRSRLLLLTLASCAPVAQGAQELTEMSLDQLLDIPVVSASRFEQKSSETPSTVSVVTQDDIRQYGWRTLGEVLRSLRGFYVHYDRGYEYVGTRGFARPQDFNTRVLLLVDGHRMNDAVYDMAYIGTDSIIDLDLVDHIEVIRGPGSSIYGSNALFGVINIVTRTAEQVNGAEVGARLSSHGTVEGRATLGTRFENGAGLLASISGMNGTGPDLFFPEFDSPQTNNGQTSHTDYTRQGRFFARLSQEGLSLTAAASRRNKGMPNGGFGGAFDDRGHTQIDTQAYVDLHYTRNLAADTELSGRAFVADYTYSMPALYGTPSVRNYDEAHGSWYGAEMKLVSALTARNKLVAGLEHQRNRIQRLTNRDEPDVINFDDRRQSERSGAFVQNDFQWTSDLKLSLGARYDWMSHQAGQFSPRLGAVYRSTAQTVWKVQYGSSFRAPNSYESNYGFPGTQRANPDLRPETIKTWEGGVEHYLDSQTRLLATAYMYRLDKLIDQISESRTGPLQYVNSGKTRAHGIELEAERLWRSGVRLRTSLDLQHAHDNRGNDLSNSPRTSAKMNLSVPLPWMSLRLGTEGQWLAGRRTDSGRVPSYGIANLTLLRPMAGDGWEWSASLYNVFDNRFYDPAAYDPGVPSRDRFAQDGRTFRVRAVYHF